MVLVASAAHMMFRVYREYRTWLFWPNGWWILVREKIEGNVARPEAYFPLGWRKCGMSRTHQVVNAQCNSRLWIRRSSLFCVADVNTRCWKTLDVILMPNLGWCTVTQGVSYLAASRNWYETTSIECNEVGSWSGYDVLQGSKVWGPGEVNSLIWSRYSSPIICIWTVGSPLESLLPRSGWNHSYTKIYLLLMMANNFNRRFFVRSSLRAPEKHVW